MSKNNKNMTNTTSKAMNASHSNRCEKTPSNSRSSWIKMRSGHKFPSGRHPWGLWLLTLVLLLLMIVALIGLFYYSFKGPSEYWSKGTIILQDDKGGEYFVGKGTSVLIAKENTLILQNDTLLLDESTHHILTKNLLSEDSVSNPYAPSLESSISKNDSLAVAVVLQDLEVRTHNNNHILYARKDERFFVNNLSKKGDSVQICYNNELFEISRKDIDFDTILAVNYKEVPFNLAYAIQVEKFGNMDLAIRLNRIGAKKDPVEVESVNGNAVSVYPLYGDQLLGRLVKTDSTYIFNAENAIGLSGQIELRFVCDNLPAYVMTATSPDDILDVKKANKEDIIELIYLIITGLLFVLLILSLVLLARFYRRKNHESNQHKKDIKARLEGLEGKLREVGQAERLFPNDFIDFEEWASKLGENRGEITLFVDCKDKIETLRKVSDTTPVDEPVERLLEDFKSSVISYLKSIKAEGLEKEYLEAKEEFLSSLLNNHEGDEVIKRTSGKGDNKPETDVPDTNGEVERLKKDLLRTEEKLARLRKEIAQGKTEEIKKIEKDYETRFEKIKNEADDRVHAAENKIALEVEKARKAADARVQDAEKKASQDVAEANRKIEKANAKAEAAEEKARKIREEVTNQFEDDIRKLNNNLIKEKNEKEDVRKQLSQTSTALNKKECECQSLNREVENKKKALESFYERITDVQPAGPYAKQVEKLLLIGRKVEKSADTLLEKGIDDYLLTKYIARYHKSLHEIDMDQFAADVLNMANVQFVYKQQTVAKYDQRDEKQFYASMKLFFYDSYLKNYISALVVFNETLAGMHHLVDGLTDKDTAVFQQLREELQSVFKALEIEVHSVKIFDSIADNIDLKVDLRPLDFDCPSGTICQIDSCIVYLAGGNKPADKIHVVVKE